MVPKSRRTVAAAPGNGGSDNAVFRCYRGGFWGFVCCAVGGVAASVPAVLVEDAAGLLASLAAAGVLGAPGVVEGLLARLLVTAQDSDNEGSDAEGSDAEGSAADGADGAGSVDGEGSAADGADGAGSVDGEGLFVGAPGGDAVVVAAAGGGFGSWVWRRLVALGCLVWGLAGWGSWPRPAIVWRPGPCGVSHLPRPA